MAKTSIRSLYGVGLLTLLAIIQLNGQRSIHRPKAKDTPTITVRWLDDPASVSKLTSRYLEKTTYFELFDHSYFFDHLLPTGPITYRYKPTQTVDSCILNAQIEKLVEEVRAHHYPFSDFTVLRWWDFNHKRLSGLIILINNHYPFVVKLFMETPKTFVRPFRKGIVPAFCFFLGGGMNRHLSGLTRVKNRYNFESIVENSPLWHDSVSLPRKWFWIPHNTRWFEITGTNFGSRETQKTTLPDTYAIVADAINLERTMTLRNKGDREDSLRLCNDVGFLIDPNITNFMLEKGTGKIAVVDTECFPTMVGLKDIGQYHSQIAWYANLSRKAFCDIFFRTKTTIAENAPTPVPPIVHKKTRRWRRWIGA